jgi:hypothetical protein
MWAIFTGTPAAGTTTGFNAAVCAMPFRAASICHPD